jgi:hypothetical protein
MISAANVGGGAFRVEAGRGREIRFGDQHKAGVGEDAGVFEGFVLALRDGEKHHPRMFSQVEHCRAHEVPDVLDEKNVEAGRPDVIGCVSHHVSVQMAGRACGYLHGRRAGTAQAPRVVVGLKVAHYHAHLPLLRAFAQRALEQRSLARTGRRQHVYRKHAGRGEPAAVRGGQFRVVLEQGAAEFDPAALGVVAVQGQRPVGVFLMFGMVVGTAAMFAHVYSTSIEATSTSRPPTAAHGDEPQAGHSLPSAGAGNRRRQTSQ